MSESVTCPYCRVTPAFGYEGFSIEGTYCRVEGCKIVSEHRHGGAEAPVACGPFTSAFTRWRRGCRKLGPHLHRSCSNCGAEWVVEVDGEITVMSDDYERGFSDGVKYARKEMRP